MRWKIRTEDKLLQLWENDDKIEGHYYIEFDRLAEPDWFLHLSGKTWINMNSLFWAFYRAYEAAGIPVREDFFTNFKDAYRNYAEIQFYDCVYTLGKRDIIPRKTNNVNTDLQEKTLIKNIISEM